MRNLEIVAYKVVTELQQPLCDRPLPNKWMSILNFMCHRKHLVSGYRAGNLQRASRIWGSSCVSGCRVCFLLEDQWRVICGSYASVEMRQHHIDWEREKKTSDNHNSPTKAFNLHSYKLLPGIGRYADERFEGVLQVDLYKKKIDQSQAHISENKPHEYTYKSFPPRHVSILCSSNSYIWT